MNTIKLKITYPLRSGQLFLRASGDWSQNINPYAQHGDTYEFFIQTPWDEFQFKPIILDHDEIYWSQGKNYTAYPASVDEMEIFPFFFNFSNRGDVSTIKTVNTSNGLYNVRIYIPPGYFENYLKHYPIVYMHDGANLFEHGDNPFGVEWRVDEMMDILSQQNLIDRFIVVGVFANRPERFRDRMRDYGPSGYHNHGLALINHIKPSIDRSFRSLRDPENTIVMGSSMGGLVSFYLAWQFPEVFGKCICMSSTFSFSNYLVERIKHEHKKNIKIYLDSGFPGDNYEDTIKVRDLLFSKGYQFGEDLFHYTYDTAGHNEYCWGKRSLIPFLFMFGRDPNVHELLKLAARWEDLDYL